LAVSGKKSREQIKITIPEGACTSDIVKIFTDAGIGTESGFYAALNDDYGYDFIPEKPRDRTYRCDGYLFPDTYWFYLDSTEHQAIAKMIENFSEKFSAKMRDAAAKHGLTVDECVTLASIIQKEAFYTAEMGAISSVFHNRLHSKTLRRLESDATLAYAWSEYGGNGDYLDIDSPYNSYKAEGLPPGAICSPGLDALDAAANPKSTNYYYFFSKKDKTFVFSKNYSEHRAALKKFGVGTERTK
ncbi:MAG: endolytic transglycosylase MltG, partial [Clostridiales bacterium]|nr:endolytic transglycosylase MltG [Clostridiales bacterium]